MQNQNQETAAVAAVSGCEPMRWPMSANGYLIVDSNGKAHHASWAAPFFVFVGPESAEDDALGLIHCDDLAHARSVARHGGTILGPDLSPLQPCRGCSAPFPHDPDADYCPTCTRENEGA